MNKNKKTLLLVLVFVLLLGGAYILYNQLSGQVARDSIVVTQEAGSISGTQETQAPEASPQAEEESPAETEAPAQEEAPAAPDFTVLDTDGQEVRLSDMQGTPVVLNFWASWCPPCKSEMPDIQALYEKYGENEGDLIVLGVANPKTDEMPNNQDGTVEEVTDYLEENGLTFPVVMDTTGELFYWYGISAFPTTFMIDANGNVYGYVSGALTADMMESIVQQTMESVE